MGREREREKSCSSFLLSFALAQRRPSPLPRRISRPCAPASRRIHPRSSFLFSSKRVRRRPWKADDALCCGASHAARPLSCQGGDDTPAKGRRAVKVGVKLSKRLKKARQVVRARAVLDRVWQAQVQRKKTRAATARSATRMAVFRSSDGFAPLRCPTVDVDPAAETETGGRGKAEKEKRGRKG